MRKKVAMIIALALIISAVNLAILAVGDRTLGDNIAHFVPMSGEFKANHVCNDSTGYCVSNTQYDCTQYPAVNGMSADCK